MTVHLKIALRLDLQIHEGVARQMGQHMVHKADPGPDAGLPAAVQSQPDADLRLFGIPGNFCFSHHLLLIIGCLYRYPGTQRLDQCVVLPRSADRRTDRTGGIPVESD